MRFQRYFTYAGIYSSSWETAWTKKVTKKTKNMNFGRFDVFLK